MHITADKLAERLKYAEEKRDAAIASAQHWEGAAATLRELLAEVNRPEGAAPEAK